VLNTGSLDEAVAVAYGWPSSAAHDPQESNRLLLELNRAIAAGEIDYRPFGTLPTVVPVGTLAPALDLPTIDGGRFDLRKERGHPVLVSFLRHAG